MKKKIICYLIASVLLFASTASESFAQSATVVDVNAQLRALFTPLAKPTSPKLFLYDMSMKFSDSTFYQKMSTDTLETEMWYKIYEEMYHAAYDTTPYKQMDTVFANASNFYEDTILMGVLNYDYYRLIDSSMTTNTYFNFDTTNTILTDKSSRPGFPFNENTIFIAAPLKSTSNFTNPVFRIDPQFIFFDYFNSANYIHGNTFKIDFGDGNGWKTFDPTKVTNWPVVYSTNGDKTIMTAVFNSSNTIVAYSVSKLTIFASHPSIPPDYSFTLPGIQCGYYYGCDAKINSGKTVIYLAGFDMGDFIPTFNRSVSRIYAEMISRDEIVQLKNEGYNFLIVDWDNSRIDIRFNALYLVNLIEQLKCGLIDDQQFVVIGESMGGLVGRYALTYMETEYYKNKDNSPFFKDALDLNNAPYLLVNNLIFNLPSQWCKMDKMHNTRLFITLDTPHQGANIPMSAQLAYRSVMNAFGVVNGIYAKLAAQAMNLFLDGQAAQQMLIYHVDTKSVIATPTFPPTLTTYTCKSDKTQFFNQLNSLGNYPQFAKVVSLSNGSLHGNGQTNNHSIGPIERVANDKLIDFGCEIYGRVLWLKIPIFGGDLKAYTNPNGAGNLLIANAGRYSVRIKLKLFGVKFTTGYVSLFAITEDAQNMKAYCTGPGGYLGDADFLKAPASSSGFNLSNNYWIFNMFHYKRTTDGYGCVTFDSHLGLNGFASTNFDYHLCSDGLQFCFIPVQSALDYGTLGTLPLDEDIENKPIATKIGLFKADVIIGYPGDYSGANNGHLGFRNELILNHDNTSTTYYSCVSSNTRVKRSFLSLEIGDEELYLENVTLPWHGDYETEFQIYVN